MEIQGERRLIAARGAAALAETLRAVRPAHDPASLEALMRSLEALARG